MTREQIEALAERDTSRRCAICNGRGGRDTERWSDAIGSTVADWLECRRCDGTGHPRAIAHTKGNEDATE